MVQSEKKTARSSSAKVLSPFTIVVKKSQNKSIFFTFFFVSPKLALVVFRSEPFMYIHFKHVHLEAADINRIRIRLTSSSTTQNQNSLHEMHHILHTRSEIPKTHDECILNI